MDTAEKLKYLNENISNQNEDLKLTMLISSRERNVYLEKLRKIEEYGEEKNWEDSSGLLKSIYEILYNDNN
jgi:hypothetical protein